MITAEKLTKYFGRRRALSSVSFTLEEGRSLALFGDNGAGKTTLLKVLATILRPTKGSVKVCGFDTVKDGQGVRERMFLFSYKNYLYENFTAFENLKFFLKLYGGGGDDEIYRSLESVGLNAFSHERARTFSSGMRKRLQMAKLFLKKNQFKLILLDEPHESLDESGRVILNTFLQAFKENGGAFVLATHQQDFGLSFCDKVALLQQGNLAFFGTKDDLKIEKQLKA